MPNEKKPPDKPVDWEAFDDYDVRAGDAPPMTPEALERLDRKYNPKPAAP